MTKPMGYFGADHNNTAIASFSSQFEKQNGECSLSEGDQSALVAFLGMWAWSRRNCMDLDFWAVVEETIGMDATGTTMEDEDEFDDDFQPVEKNSPMYHALSALDTLIDPAQCYSIIAWLVQ